MSDQNLNMSDHFWIWSVKLSIHIPIVTMCTDDVNQLKANTHTHDVHKSKSEHTHDAYKFQSEHTHMCINLKANTHTCVYKFKSEHTHDVHK